MQSTFLSTVDCAELKGVSRQAIVAAIRRGALPAQKIGTEYIIRKEDCDAYNPAMSAAEKGARTKGISKRAKPGEQKPEEAS